jgi:hypothetical protein
MSDTTHEPREGLYTTLGVEGVRRYWLGGCELDEVTWTSLALEDVRFAILLSPDMVECEDIRDKGRD